jgi:hypothetical protein
LVANVHIYSVNISHIHSALLQNYLHYYCIEFYLMKYLSYLLLIFFVGALSLGADNINTNKTYKHDTSVNHCQLMWWKSVVNKFRADTAMLNERIEATWEHDFQFVDMVNDDESQVMIAYIHRGYHDLAFAEFRVKYLKDYRLADSALRITDKVFKTSNGIKLGMNTAEVLKRLGNPFQKFNRKDIVILEYRNNDKDGPFLKKYLQDSYFAYYKFRNDSLLQYHFGFDVY